MRPRALLLALSAVLTVPVLAIVAPVAPAGAQEVPAAPVALPEGVARWSLDLSGVAVEGNAARAAQAAYDLVNARRIAAEQARSGAQIELLLLAERDIALTEAIAVQTDARKSAALRLATARRAVQQVAAGAYVISATYDDLSRLVDVQSSSRIGAGQVMSESVQEQRQRDEADARGDVRDASRAIDVAQRDRVVVRDRQQAVADALRRAEVDLVESTMDLGVRLHELRQARAVSTVRGLDFALVALDAYVAAAETQPECGIEWWALAGISRVEGRHGTYGGSELEADGEVTRRIIGIPLTGENGTAAIGDTDDGALDGDATVDRAVGPMQFIPSTWARWGRDGDGDGDEDPQNLYDATAAAAAYLCAGRRVADDAGLRAGYFSYNHSEPYVETVLGFARGYQRFRIPAPGPPPPVPPTIPSVSP